jgi:hypothetical protein
MNNLPNIVGWNSKFMSCLLSIRLAQSPTPAFPIENPFHFQSPSMTFPSVVIQIPFKDPYLSTLFFNGLQEKVLTIKLFPKLDRCDRHSLPMSTNG